MAKVGIWLMGAQGSLASTVVLGARAIARGLAAGGGLVTELPELAALPLVRLGNLAFGGWDIAPTGLVEHARVTPGFADGGAPQPARTGLGPSSRGGNRSKPPSSDWATTSIGSGASRSSTP